MDNLFVVGQCKTENSQKPVPLHDYLAETLRLWRRHTIYCGADDWIFASPRAEGKRPYWGQPIMRHHIHPVLRRLNIAKRVVWHTFRHTYSTLLKEVALISR